VIGLHHVSSRAFGFRYTVGNKWSPGSMARHIGR